MLGKHFEYNSFTAIAKTFLHLSISSKP